MNTQTQDLTAQLIRAAEAGDTPTVLSRLQAGTEINGRDDRGRTAIMAATYGNRVDTVRALLQAGADVNIRDNCLDNPLLYAGAEGLLENLKLAIEAQADTRLTNRFGGVALTPASERGHVDIVTELLTHTDIDVNHVNNLGWTALLEAIILSNGGPRHQQIVHLLVDHGADIDLPDKDGLTPLAHARRRALTASRRTLSHFNPAALQAGPRSPAEPPPLGWSPGYPALPRTCAPPCKLHPSTNTAPWPAPPAGAPRLPAPIG